MYLSLFEQADIDRDGYVSSVEAVEFLRKSELGNNELAEVQILISFVRVALLPFKVPPLISSLCFIMSLSELHLDLERSPRKQFEATES